MPLIRLAAVADIPEGAVREAVVDGRSYAICRSGDEIFVVDGDCPHREGPLGHGAFHGHTLVCPWHAWEFDVRTGQCTHQPDCRIGAYRVHVADEAIHIEVR